MSFNLNISINGLRPVVSIINTIPEDLANIRRSLKLAALDIIEAQVLAEKRALLPARDERAELLAKITELETEIRGRLINKPAKPAKRGPGRPGKAI